MNESQEDFWAAVFSKNKFAGEARVVQGGVLTGFLYRNRKNVEAAGTLYDIGATARYERKM